MKLKRILYCILSLVVVLCFLPGCELFLKEPKKPKKPKKEWPCDVVPQEPPTEYGNFIAFKLNGIPFAYAHCRKGHWVGGVPSYSYDIRHNDGKYDFFFMENRPLCNGYSTSVTCSFTIPDDYKFNYPLQLSRFICIVFTSSDEPAIKWGYYRLIPDQPNEIRLISYDKCSGVCRGYFNAYLASEKMLPDPNDPEKTIYVPDDTIRLTNGVISIMNPVNISSCKE